MIKKTIAILSIIFLSMAILLLLFRIHAVQGYTNEISSRSYENNVLIATGTGDLKVKVNDPISGQDNGIEYILCDTQWVPITTKKINKKGVALFKNVPVGTYKLKRVRGDMEKKLILSAYVAEEMTTTVLDRIQNHTRYREKGKTKIWLDDRAGCSYNSFCLKNDCGHPSL